MKNRWLAGATALACTVAGLTVLTTSAHASVASAARPPVVTISVSGDTAQVSPAVIRPGVVEFTVGKTFKVPGPNGGPDGLSVLQTDQLPLVLSSLPAVFGGDPTDPAVAAAAAAAMRTIHAVTTFYGGGHQGTTWRVVLPAGTYTVMGVQSTAMGLAKPATFVVAGQPRSGMLPTTQAAIRAVGPAGQNKWTFRQSSAPVDWLRFTNSAHELHFLDMNSVKESTTAAMIKKAFMSPKEPTFGTGQHMDFDVISPGVSVAIKGPIAPEHYLVDCFIPSETDGMPHALMGMWKLIDIR